MSKSLKQKFLMAIGVILLLCGIAAGILLVQQGQEIREKAATQN